MVFVPLAELPVTLCVHDYIIMCVLVQIFKPTYMIKEKASWLEISINYHKVQTEQDNMYVILSINTINIK